MIGLGVRSKTPSTIMTKSKRRSESYPKMLRLLASHEFQHVFAQQRRVTDSTLIVFGARQLLSYPRLGLVVSRKVGNAVERNRWKRHLRETFRRHRNAMPSGLDIVVLPRRGATCTAASVNHSLPLLVRKLARRLGATGQ